MGFSSLFEWYFSHLNYWVLTILMILENSLVPLPAELIVAPAAYRAAHGEMSLVSVIMCSTLGSTVGALINYWLSRHLGRYLVYRFAESRVGRVLMLDSAKMEKAEQLFLRHGNISTFFGRLLPFGRQLISIPAGLAKMPVWSFLLYTTVGSAIWNGLLSGAGYYLAQILPREKLAEALDEYSNVSGIIFFIAIPMIYIIYRYVRKRRSSKEKNQ